LRHLIRRIRKRWPAIKILVRGDSHYGNGAVLDALEDMACDYILGFSINEKLKAIAEPWREQCRRRKSDRQKLRRFHSSAYRAKRWRQNRKVIARIEATAAGTDARIIVTNIQGRGKTLYEKVYCARGAAENLIKDWKLYTRADKTACHRWPANQFRVRPGRHGSYPCRLDRPHSCTSAPTGCCMACAGRRLESDRFWWNHQKRESASTS
jgi:hypothetical protein